MLLPVTALYAALLGLQGLVLATLVGIGRRKTPEKISLGDGGNRKLIEANRRHMNWVENVPLLIVYMAIIELNGGSKVWLNVLGIALFIARIIHPFGIDATSLNRRPRLVGARLTMLVLLCAIGTLLWQTVSSVVR